MSPRSRLGAVLLIPEPVRREIDAFRLALGDGSRGRVPAHLTLVPPVNVNDRDLGEALHRLRDAAAEAGPLSITLGPAKTFLPDNPVLYLAIAEGRDGIEDLRARIFRPPLERTPSWPYVPHVTICDDGAEDRIRAGVTALADYRARVDFTHVHLLRQEGGGWEPWADARLGGRRVVGRGSLQVDIAESERLGPDDRVWLDAQWRAHNERAGKVWDEQHFALTARHDGSTVGVATGWTNEGVAHLGELMVAPDVRGYGIGGHLLAAFEDVARRRGCSRLTLRTGRGTTAEEIYAGRGWRVEAVFDDWVSGFTTVQMRKDV